MPNNEFPISPDEMFNAIQRGLDNKLSHEDLARLQDKVREWTEGQGHSTFTVPPTPSLGEFDAGAQPAADVDPYVATAWGGDVQQDFTCPSGQKCLVQRVDIMDLMSEGLLNNVDMLTSIVNSDLIPKSGAQSSAAVQSIVGNPENMTKFRESMRKVVMRAVLQPKLHESPADRRDRVRGVVYIDTVAMTDQIAIFNWVVTGKEAEELKQFREATGESVGNMEDVEGVRTETVELPRSESSN